jgi:hypothetical protein
LHRLGVDQRSSAGVILFRHSIQVNALTICLNLFTHHSLCSFEIDRPQIYSRCRAAAIDATMATTAAWRDSLPISPLRNAPGLFILSSGITQLRAQSASHIIFLEY